MYARITVASDAVGPRGNPLRRTMTGILLLRDIIQGSKCSISLVHGVILHRSNLTKGPIHENENQYSLQQNPEHGPPVVINNLVPAR